MAKKKFYAVKVGKIPGIYGTWSETEKQVKGFPGAVYKSFSTEEEAIRFISCEDIKEIKNVSDTTTTTNKKIEQEIKNLQDREVIAFVDGSHSLDTDGKEKYSFGVVLLTNEQDICQIILVWLHRFLERWNFICIEFYMINWVILQLEQEKMANLKGIILLSLMKIKQQEILNIIHLL